MALVATILLLVIGAALVLAAETGGILLWSGVSYHHGPAHMTGIHGS
jgi:hypothetical protein